MEGGVEGPPQDGGAMEDPLLVSDDMIGERIGHNEIRKAQPADEFVETTVERMETLGIDHPKVGKWAIIDGALYRVTRNADPNEGREPQRIYVPEVLRQVLMRNYHSTIWAKHQHSTSMYKQMISWYYWSSMEKDIQKYVGTCELCQLAKGTKPSRQGHLPGWKHSTVLHTVCMD